MGHDGLSRRSFLRGGAAAVALGATGGLGSGCTTARTSPGVSPSRATVSASGASQSEPGRSAGATLVFPTGFSWGAATSAYQIEGAATADGKGPSVWDTFSHRTGAIADGGTGDVAADHYHRYAQDLELMSALGLRSYRFSISWPRVLPSGRRGAGGAVNQHGLDFYKRLVDGLHRRGIQPVATLWHWDTPQALQDTGGWESRDTASYFADYAALMHDALGDMVATWLTVNEPKTIVDVAYLAGAYAPGRRDATAAYTAAHHMLLGHGLAARALKSAAPHARIGPVLNLAPVLAEPAGDPKARAAARLRDGYENRLYLDPILTGTYPADVLADLTRRGVDLMAVVEDGDLETISVPIDVLGVDYYTPVVVDATGSDVIRYPVAQAQWEQIYPAGLFDILTRLRRDYGDVPVSITENGIATVQTPAPDGTVDDGDRITYLHDHLVELHRAIAAGVRVDGYHVWSLLDNFEWAQGYTQRWGLIDVDFVTQRRTPKRSAWWYRDVIAANGVSSGPVRS